jgi:uncharacterized 2Fe-2S/4Fe-4S cluster protein (DUF4445 family)
VESICGGKGVCGKCKIRVEEGYFPKYRITSAITSTKAKSRANEKFLNRMQMRRGYRLACQTLIHGDIVVFVPEESRKGQQVVRKEATAREIKLKPAVRKYYVELKPATLHDPLGDFERLQGELGRKYKLKDLTIDYPTLLTLQNTVRKGDWKG